MQKCKAPDIWVLRGHWSPALHLHLHSFLVTNHYMHTNALVLEHSNYSCHKIKQENIDLIKRFYTPSVVSSTMLGAAQDSLRHPEQRLLHTVSSLPVTYGWAEWMSKLKKRSLWCQRSLELALLKDITACTDKIIIHTDSHSEIKYICHSITLRTTRAIKGTKSYMNCLLNLLPSYSGPWQSLEWDSESAVSDDAGPYTE